MTARALLVTDDEQLRKNVTALSPDGLVALSLGEVDPDAWRLAPLILLDDRDAGDVVLLGIPRRPGLLLIGQDLDDATVWMRAVSVGAEHVLFLPDAAEWIAARLATAFSA